MAYENHNKLPIRSDTGILDDQSDHQELQCHSWPRIFFTLCNLALLFPCFMFCAQSWKLPQLLLFEIVFVVTGRSEVKEKMCLSNKCFLWNKEEYGEAELVPNNWSTSRKLWSLQLLFCLGGLMACLSYTYSDICINATLQTKHHSYGSFGGVGGVMDSTTSFYSLFHYFMLVE